MFQTKRVIEFSMCDNAGVLFFSRIFELFHSAYEEFIQRSSLENNYFNLDDLAIPLVKIEADFKAPIMLHEVMDIVIEVTEIKNSAFELTTHFLDKIEKTRAIVKSVHIFVDKQSFSKKEIPTEFRLLLEANQD